MAVEQVFCRPCLLNYSDPVNNYYDPEFSRGLKLPTLNKINLVDSPLPGCGIFWPCGDLSGEYIRKIYRIAPPLGRGGK